MNNTYIIPYYLALMIAVPIGLFAIFSDFGEVFNRLVGHTTVMSQISWLSDNLAIIYCALSGIFYLVFLSILCREIYLKRYKAVIITATIIFVSFIIQVILEDMYIYYKPV